MKIYIYIQPHIYLPIFSKTKKHHHRHVRENKLKLVCDYLYKVFESEVQEFQVET